MSVNLQFTLRALLEAAEKTTPRPWESDGCMIDQKSTPFAEVVTADCKPCGWSGCSGARVEATEADLKYIALAANLAPALARFTLVALPLLQNGGECDVCGHWLADEGHDYCPLATLERELGEVSGG